MVLLLHIACLVISEFSENIKKDVEVFKVCKYAKGFQTFLKDT